MQPVRSRQADFLLVEINNAEFTRPAVILGEERGLLFRTAANNRARRKTDFGFSVTRSDLLAINSVTSAFTIFHCLEYEFLKGFFGPRATAVILKILHPFKVAQ